jgi:KTSC domain
MKFAYDPSARSLVIFFKSGSVYEYPGVPQEIFEGLRAASSKGQYFHRSIRPQFAGRVLSPGEIAGFALATGQGATRTARGVVLVEIASLERPAAVPVFF